MRAHLTMSIGLLAPLAFIGAACGAPTASSPGTAPGSAPGTITGTLTVSAAASLAAPFKTIGHDFETAHPGVRVTFNFDSSSTLAQQIRDGSPADGFAAADEASMKMLADAGLIAGPPTVFARNRLTIVVKKGNPKRVTSLADLTTAGTISLCGATVPCGRYADQILNEANATIPPDRITRGQNVKATFTAVAEGDADAGIVYVTDVTGDKVEAVAIPEAQNAVAIYPIGVVKASTNQTTMAAFAAYVTGPTGQATLRAAGFLAPP